MSNTTVRSLRMDAKRWGAVISAADSEGISVNDWLKGAVERRLSGKLTEHAKRESQLDPIDDVGGMQALDDRAAGLPQAAPTNVCPVTKGKHAWKNLGWGTVCDACKSRKP